MTDSDCPSSNVFLIATVGGSPEPLMHSLLRWKPAKIHFLASAESRFLPEQILDQVARQGFTASPGAWDCIIFRDEQNLLMCVEDLRQLRTPVRRWNERGGNHHIVVDPTGGTKMMTAALALTARQWPCRFSYVGGRERTRNGLGVVVPGAEQIVVSQNPWNALGYQAVEEVCLLFNQMAFAPALDILEKVVRNMDDPAAKRGLATLMELVRAYLAWDRFQHGDALVKVGNTLKNTNDFSALFGHDRAADLGSALGDHRDDLKQIVDAGELSRPLVLDLVANAGRRKREGRFDDAVARLYRAIEAIAQLQLRDVHDIHTSRVSPDCLPPLLREEWGARAEDGCIRLGLQDGYRLLQAWGDPLGQRFSELGLDGRQQSPLAARNSSILAHGHQPVSESVVSTLWNAVLTLGGIQETQLASFPCLGTADLQDRPRKRKGD